MSHESQEFHGGIETEWNHFPTKPRRVADKNNDNQPKIILEIHKNQMRGLISTPKPSINIQKPAKQIAELYHIYTQIIGQLRNNKRE